MTKVRDLSKDNRPADIPSGHLKQRPSPLLFALAVTGMFAIVVLFGLVHHEMWRDELQAWMVARDAHSLGGLLDNMRYEGNPALWHFFLFLITRFTHDPVYMQGLHFLIACGFIFVFNRYAEIAWPYKIMFSFGYFTVYEYSVISRCYGLALLLIMVVCALYKNRRSHYILVGVVLALLANVTIYGAIFSMGFLGILLLDHFFFQEKDNKQRVHLIVGAAIAVAGVLLCICQVLPEKDNSFPMQYAGGIFEFDRWGSVFSRLFTTYFYIPQTEMNFWNTNCYFDTSPQIQRPVADWFFAHSEYIWFWYVLPAIAFILSIAIFIRKPLILLLYTGITVGLLCFYYYTNLLYSRYCGFLLVILIVCYWLDKYYPEKEYKDARLIRLANFGKKIQTPFLIVVLATNICGAAVAYAKDYLYDFSPSKKVATYIRENKLDTMTISGASFYLVSPLAAYLDTPLYYFQMSDFGSFCIYNSHVIWDMPVPEINKRVVDLMRQGCNKLLLVSSYEWKYTNDGGAHFVPLRSGIIADDIKIDFLKSFDAGIVADEQYYIYLIHK